MRQETLKHLASWGKDINGFAMCFPNHAIKPHKWHNTVYSNSVPTIKPCNDAVSSHDACPQGDNV